MCVHFKYGWPRESNPQSKRYQCRALPTELLRTPIALYLSILFIIMLRPLLFLVLFWNQKTLFINFSFVLLWSVSWIFKCGFKSSLSVLGLKGDFRSCPYIALNRQETDTMEFFKIKTLSANSLWALLGHAPQVSAPPPPHRRHRDNQHTVLSCDWLMLLCFCSLTERLNTRA